MFDIGWPEMAVIALVALIVIGPKELPRVLRSVAHWSRKARALAREFQSGIDDMVREADLEDAKKTLDRAKHLDFDKALEDTVDPTGEVKEGVKELGETARDTVAGNDEADAVAVTTKKTDGKAAATPEGKDKAEPAARQDEPAATIVKHPVKMAPPHSIEPPAEPEKTRAVPPKKKKKRAPQKTGTSAGP